MVLDGIVPLLPVGGFPSRSQWSSMALYHYFQWEAFLPDLSGPRWHCTATSSGRLPFQIPVVLDGIVPLLPAGGFPSRSQWSSMELYRYFQWEASLPDPSGPRWHCTTTSSGRLSFQISVVLDGIVPLLPVVGFPSRSQWSSMALYRYFQREASLPDPSGPRWNCTATSSGRLPFQIPVVLDGIVPLLPVGGFPSRSQWSSMALYHYFQWEAFLPDPSGPRWHCTATSSGRLPSRSQWSSMALYRYFQREASLPDPSGPRWHCTTTSSGRLPFQIPVVLDGIVPLLPAGGFPSRSQWSSMALYRYFQREASLPDPSGPRWHCTATSSGRLSFQIPVVLDGIVPLLPVGGFPSRSQWSSMALYRYFQWEASLPDPSGPRWHCTTTSSGRLPFQIPVVLDGIVPLLPAGGFPSRSQWSSMALYRYFQREASLPDPSSPLSESASPASIRDANDAVTKLMQQNYLLWLFSGLNETFFQRNFPTIQYLRECTFWPTN